MKIPWIEFQLGIVTLAPDCKTQDIAPAPYVHVFDRRWFRDDFWPHWCEVRRELDAKIGVRPMTNNARRRICEEINKRFIAELVLSTRIAYDDEDVSPGAVESSVVIPSGFALCGVRDGVHRNALVALTDDGVKHSIEFVEPQLRYADYESCPLLDALAGGVVLRECWM